MSARKNIISVAVVWLALVGLTFVSVGGFGGRHALALVILGIAGLKAALIASEYMELREAPRGLSLAFAAWLIATLATLGYLYTTS